MISSVDTRHLLCAVSSGSSDCRGQSSASTTGVDILQVCYMQNDKAEWDVGNLVGVAFNEKRGFLFVEMVGCGK